jgi:hypothetical protein
VLQERLLPGVDEPILIEVITAEVHQGARVTAHRKGRQVGLELKATARKANRRLNLSGGLRRRGRRARLSARLSACLSARLDTPLGYRGAHPRDRGWGRGGVTINLGEPLTWG